MSRPAATRLPIPVSIQSVCAAQLTNDQIREIQEIYRYLYLSRLNVSDAVDRIEAEIAATTERDEIIEFIRNSKRGIVRGYV